MIKNFILIIFFFLINQNLFAQNNSRGVIGISYDFLDGNALVTTVYANSPAKKSGILVGDMLYKIDNQLVEKIKDINELENLFKGSVNSPIKIIVNRNNRNIEFNFKRVANKDIFNCNIKNLSSEDLMELVYAFNGNEEYKEVFECTLIGHKKGYINHTANLAYLYSNGVFVEKNYKKAIELYEIGVSKNNSQSMTELALMYDLGEGVKQNFKKAIELYKKAIEFRDPWAMYNMALVYEEGRGIEKNIEESIRLYELAADQNHALSLNNLGYKYQYGEYYQKDLGKAYELYKKAADLGEPIAITNLGICYRDGNCAEKNIDEAVRLFRIAADNYNHSGGAYNLSAILEENEKYLNLEESIKYLKFAAEQGLAEAQYDLAWKYNNGDGIEKNNKEALKLYTLAAEQDFDIAHYNLAMMYEGKEKGIGMNIEKTLFHYQKAADLGYADAYYNMSFLYSNGIGVTLDNHKAVKILKECVKEINAPACLDGLAWHYSNAKGVRQNDKESVRLLKLAVEQDYVRAMGNLAWYYQNGYGIENNSEEAVRLFQIAADREDPYSQSQLGWHYENGEGVETNLETAYYYYNLASKNGNDFGEDSLAKLIEKYPKIIETYLQKTFSEKSIVKKDQTSELKKDKKISSKDTELFAMNKQISNTEDSKFILVPIESEFVVIKKTSVRQKPSSDSGRVKMVNIGDIIYIPGKHKESDWYAVENESGVKIGYIYKSSIKEVGSTEVVAKAIGGKWGQTGGRTTYNIDWGSYYALVIGNDRYKNFNKLLTPILDASLIGLTLKNKYGFTVEILKNASRNDILDKLYEYRSILSSNDNFLIYYAGHGSEDKMSKEGYWQPIGSQPNRPSSWISNSEIITSLRGLNAKHIIIIVDSCFSGAILRTKGSDINLDIFPKTKLELEKFYKKKNEKISRVAITSGNLEPVPDSLKNSKHSPFAKSLIDILEDNEEVLLSSVLFVKLEKYLTKYSNFQETLYSPLAIEDHNYGGHFIFVPSN